MIYLAYTALLLFVFTAHAASLPGRVSQLDLGGRQGEWEAPTPTPWPLQFHATLLQNRSDKLALVDLFYDWPGGRNLNIIHSQLGRSLYDVEWQNRSSFYFDRTAGSCKSMTFPVGILTPTWLEGAQYLGTQTVDNHTTSVFTKAEFIVYYEEIATGRPVRWIFMESKAQFEVMSWDVGMVAAEAEWQAPASCFQGNTSQPTEQGLGDVALPLKP